MVLRTTNKSSDMKLMPNFMKICSFFKNVKVQKKEGNNVKTVFSSGNRAKIKE
jgi:hypothetical protein